MVNLGKHRISNNNLLRYGFSESRMVFGIVRLSFTFSKYGLWARTDLFNNFLVEVEDQNHLLRCELTT